MKKYLFAALGAGLLMTSCQSDEPFAPGNGTAQQVAFTVSLPDAVSTRAGGTNSAAGGVSNNINADVTFNVALYLGENLVYAHKQTVSSTGNHTSATFEPTLVIGEQYRVVAFAEFDNDATATGKGETPATNMGLIKMESGINNEKNDEYFVSTTLTAAPELSATLKRPYGKLRLIAEDLHEAERQFGAAIESVEVTYKHTRPTNFNVIAGTFDPAYTEAAQKFTANYGEYTDDTNDSRTIFVDYLPGKFDGTESMVPFTVTVKFVGGKTYTRDFNQDIPVKRNHLTTLKGRLFTIDSDLTLTIEETFEGETESNFANDLEWVAANGGTVNLTEDITLTEALNVTKNMVINLDEDVTINGNINVAEGVNLTVNGGEIINTNDAVSGITSNGDLTLNDVEITSARHAIRVESGKAVINGGVYKVVPTSNKTLHALNVGDNGTTAEVIIKGGTFIGPKGTMADSGSAVNVRSGSTVAIEGGDFSGGKTKTLANGGTLTVTGGSFDQNPTAFVANGYKAIAKDGKYYVVPAEAEAVATTADELGVAINEGNETIALTAGTYVIPNAAKGKTLSFIGTGNPEDVKIATNQSGSYEGCNYALDGSTVVFENITITTDGKTYTGYARCNATYKNCVINNTYTLYGNSLFENCTFNVNGDAYNIWTWGAPNATFNNCVFNSHGKSMLLYGQANTKLTMNYCVFNDNGTISEKAAIEIGNDYDKSYELIVNNATVNGFDINPNGINTGTTLWANKNSMPKDKLNVVVDGVDVY